jgi:hypothetical protein
LAAATVAPVPVLELGLALAVALALAVPDGDTVGLADGLGWCLANAESAALIDPLCTAMTAPSATPAATGMAIMAAIRARRRLCER